ncbi:MAG TPA: glycosyltransferase family 39 protein, partial [Candidatus Bathyarchaeia archaeon]|nr:glycosyltransferase family 39 protein [Candidatus Bathyarchaeia archaeon]
AVFVVQGLISAATVFLIYRSTSAVASRRAGLVAAGVAAVYPNLIAYNLTTLTETIGVLFAMLLLTLLVVEMPETRRSILAAVVMFFGFTFRPVLLLFAPGVFLSIKRRWTFALATVILLTPLIAFEMTAGRSFQRSAVAVFETYHPRLDGSSFVNPANTELGSDTLSSSVYLRAALANIVHHKQRAIENVYFKASVLFSLGWDTFVLQPIVGSSTFAYYVFAYAYIPIMVLGFIGMARLYGARNRMLALPALSYAVTVILFFLFKFRYRLLIEPVLIMYASMLIAGTGAEARAGSEAGEPRAPGAVRGRSNRDILAVILALACALRVYFALAHRWPAFSAEGAMYDRLALQGGIGSGAAPLYPLLLRGVYALFGSGNHAALFLVQGLLNVLAIVLLYKALERLCGGTAAAIAAAVCAVFPDFLLYDLSVGPESMSVLLVTALMAASTARFGARARSSLAAALAALGILLQPLLVCLVPGAFLSAEKRRLFVLVAVLALVPFVAGSAARTRKIEPVYQAQSFNLGLGNFTGPGAVGHAIDAVYGNAQVVMTRTWGVSDVSAPEQEDQGPSTAGYSYSAIMFLGFVGLARYYRRAHGSFALPALLYIVLIVLFSEVQVQYRAPLEPVLIAYAAILLAGPWRRRAACPEER